MIYFSKLQKELLTSKLQMSARNENLSLLKANLKAN